MLDTFVNSINRLVSWIVKLIFTSFRPFFLVQHPAALPEPINPLSNPSWKLPPPAPSLKISKVANGKINTLSIFNYVFISSIVVCLCRNRFIVEHGAIRQIRGHSELSAVRLSRSFRCTAEFDTVEKSRRRSGSAPADGVHPHAGRRIINHFMNNRKSMSCLDDRSDD